MEMGKLRAWWWHRQGLDGSLAGASPAEVFERTGIEQTASYVKEHLGDARSFSLDSPRSRAPRIAALAASRSA